MCCSSEAVVPVGSPVTGGARGGSLLFLVKCGRWRSYVVDGRQGKGFGLKV